MRCFRRITTLTFPTLLINLFFSGLARGEMPPTPPGGGSANTTIRIIEKNVGNTQFIVDGTKGDTKISPPVININRTTIVGGDASVAIEDDGAPEETFFRDCAELDDPIDLDPSLSFPEQLEITLTDLEFERGWTPPKTIAPPYVLQIFTGSWKIQNRDRTTVYLARLVGSNGKTFGFTAAQPPDWNSTRVNRHLDRPKGTSASMVVTNLAQSVSIPGGGTYDRQAMFSMLVENNQILKLRLVFPAVRSRKMGERREVATLLSARRVETVVKAVPLPLANPPTTTTAVPAPQVQLPAQTTSSPVIPNDAAPPMPPLPKVNPAPEENAVPREIPKK